MKLEVKQCFQIKIDNKKYLLHFNLNNINIFPLGNQSKRPLNFHNWWHLAEQTKNFVEQDKFFLSEKLLVLAWSQTSNLLNIIQISTHINHLQKRISNFFNIQELTN